VDLPPRFLYFVIISFVCPVYDYILTNTTAAPIWKRIVSSSLLSPRRSWCRSSWNRPSASGRTFSSH